MQGPPRRRRGLAAAPPPFDPIRVEGRGDDLQVIPSAAATRRLAEQLSARSQVFRMRTAMDFTLIASLLRIGRPAAAERALDGHREALRIYAQDLGALVAEAAAEREAEAALVEGELDDLAALPEVAEPTPPAATGRSPRRGLAGVLAAAALAVVGMVAPGLRPPVPVASDPEEALAAAQLAAARQRLANLQAAPAQPDDVIAEARELHDRILALPPDLLADQEVREQVDRILVDEQRTLNSLAPAHPESRALLEEVRALRATLDLRPHLEVVPAAADAVAEDVLPVDVPADVPSVLASALPVPVASDVTSILPQHPTGHPGAP